MEGAETGTPPIRIVTVDVLPLPVALLCRITAPRAAEQQVPQVDGRECPDAKGDSHILYATL